MGTAPAWWRKGTSATYFPSARGMRAVPLRLPQPKLASGAPDDHAEVGVGTLIVFIGMVLVATVAASILLHTMGDLTETADRTGRDAVREVSSNVEVRGVYGNVTDGRVTNVTVYLALGPGSDAVDLSTVRIRHSDGTNPVKHFAQTNTGEPDCIHYRTLWKRGAGTNSVMEAGDLVAAILDLGDCGAAYKLEPRVPVELRLVPEAGGQVTADFRTPNTYGTSAYVTLR